MNISTQTNTSTSQNQFDKHGRPQSYDYGSFSTPHRQQYGYGSPFPSQSPAYGYGPRYPNPPYGAQSGYTSPYHAYGSYPGNYGYNSSYPAYAAQTGGYGYSAPHPSHVKQTGGSTSPYPSQGAQAGGYGWTSPYPSQGAHTGGYGSPYPVYGVHAGGYSPYPAYGGQTGGYGYNPPYHSQGAHTGIYGYSSPFPSSGINSTYPSHGAQAASHSGQTSPYPNCGSPYPYSNPSPIQRAYSSPALNSSPSTGYQMYGGRRYSSYYPPAYSTPNTTNLFSGVPNYSLSHSNRGAYSGTWHLPSQQSYPTAIQGKYPELPISPPDVSVNVATTPALAAYTVPVYYPPSTYTTSVPLASEHQVVSAPSPIVLQPSDPFVSATQSHGYVVQSLPTQPVVQRQTSMPEQTVTYVPTFQTVTLSPQRSFVPTPDFALSTSADNLRESNNLLAQSNILAQNLIAQSSQLLAQSSTNIANQSNLRSHTHMYTTTNESGGGSHHGWYHGRKTAG